jgi:hypothetical protein
VLLISGYAAASEGHGLELPPGARFLAKPFTPSGLLHAVAGMGAGLRG